MKPITIILIMASLIGSAYAQIDKTVVASASYLTTYTINDKKVIDDICLLDITKTNSYFFSKTRADYKVKAQEIFDRAKATGTMPSVNLRDFQMGKTYVAYSLKSFPKKEALSIQAVGTQMFGYVKYPNAYKNWKILSDTMTIAGLKCQKAELNIDKDLVTAWFSKEIPLQDGPFSFFGLPGLILKLSTTDGWEAQFLGISYHKDGIKQLDVVAYTAVEKDDFLKAMANAKATRGNELSVPGLTVRKQN